MLLIGWLNNTSAQVQVQQLLKECDSLYRYGEFELAIQKANEGLANPKLNNQQKIEFERILAFSYAIIEKPTESEKHFTNILALNPLFTLDSIRTSPKIYQRFRIAEQNFQKTSKKVNAKETVSIDTTIIKKYGILKKQTERLQTNWKSLQIGFFCPGAGMIYCGEKTKGWLFITTEMVLVSSAIYATFEVKDSRNAYLNEKSINRIETKYKNYRDWQYLRDGLWITTSAIHLIGFSDLLLRKHQIQLSLKSSPEFPFLQVTLPVQKMQILH